MLTIPIFHGAASQGWKPGTTIVVSRNATGFSVADFTNAKKTNKKSKFIRGDC